MQHQTSYCLLLYSSMFPPLLPTLLSALIFPPFPSLFLGFFSLKLNMPICFFSSPPYLYSFIHHTRSPFSSPTGTLKVGLLAWHGQGTSRMLEECVRRMDTTEGAWRYVKINCLLRFLSSVQNFSHTYKHKTYHQLLLFYRASTQGLWHSSTMGNMCLLQSATSPSPMKSATTLAARMTRSPTHAALLEARMAITSCLQGKEG